MSIYVTVYIEIYVYTYIIYILDFGEFKQDSEFLKIYVFSTIGFLLYYHYLMSVQQERNIFILAACVWEQLRYNFFILSTATHQKI